MRRLGGNRLARRTTTVSRSSQRFGRGCARDVCGYLELAGLSAGDQCGADRVQPRAPKPLVNRLIISPIGTYSRQGVLRQDPGAASEFPPSVIFEEGES